MVTTTPASTPISRGLARLRRLEIADAVADERRAWTMRLLDLGEDLRADGHDDAARRVFALVEARP